MPPRQRLAVHFVGDERGWLHRLREPKRLVVAVGRATENRRDFLHLRTPILAPVVTECTHSKKPAQSAAKSECDSRANSEGDETTATNRSAHHCRCLARSHSVRRST